MHPKSSLRKRLLVVLLLGVALCSCLTGCQRLLNPETGQTEYRLDPNAVSSAEQITESGIGVLTILSAIWPTLLPIATLAGGIYGTWMKIKPQLTEYQTKSEMYHTAGTATAQGIEEFKKLYPDEWKKLCEELEKIKSKLISPDDQLKIENIIRGFRGLPPIS